MIQLTANGSVPHRPQPHRPLSPSRRTRTVLFNDELTTTTSIVMSQLQLAIVFSSSSSSSSRSVISI